MPDEDPPTNAARTAEALAHELANVLGIVGGVAELLDRTLPEGEHGADVARLHAAASRGVAVLQGLRALAAELGGG